MPCSTSEAERQKPSLPDADRVSTVRDWLVELANRSAASRLDEARQRQRCTSCVRGELEGDRSSVSEPAKGTVCVSLFLRCMHSFYFCAADSLVLPPLPVASLICFTRNPPSLRNTIRLPVSAIQASSLLASSALIDLLIGLRDIMTNQSDMVARLITRVANH